MGRARLSDSEIDTELQATPGWSRSGDKLTRTLVFEDFVSAFGFMASAALVAERMNHHPDWSNVYRTVTIALNTHDAGGITALDFELARAMNKLATRVVS